MGKQYNLQIQVRDETRELFKQTFQGSGQDSQGSFLRELLDVYLSDDNVKIVDNPEIIAKVEKLEENLKAYSNHPMLTALLAKNKGKVFKLKNKEIKAETTWDIFEICMNSITE